MSDGTLETVNVDSVSVRIVLELDYDFYIAIYFNHDDARVTFLLAAELTLQKNSQSVLCRILNVWVSGFMVQMVTGRNTTSTISSDSYKK